MEVLRMQTKSWIGIMGSIFLLSILFLTGCGGQKEEVVQPQEKSEYVYVAEYQYINADGYSPHLATFNQDGSLYFVGNKIKKGDKLFSLALGEKKAKEIPLDLEESMFVSGMGRDPKGNLVIICSQYDKTLLWAEVMKISPDGTKIHTLDVTDLFIDIPNFEARSILEDEEGNYYIGSGKSVYAVSPDGEILHEFKSDENIGNLFFTKEGKIVVALYNSGNLMEADLKSKKLRSLKNDIPFNDGVYQSGGEKDLLYSQGNTLYTCNIDDKEPVEILNWMDSEINGQSLNGVTLLEDGRIAAFASQSSDLVEGGESEFILLTKTKRSEVKEKTVLTYGYAFYNTLHNIQILRFNKESKDYKIEMKQYGGENADDETRRRLLQTDIISGKGPDIIDMGLLFSSTEHYEFMEMGILEDLNPYFEKDSEIKREDYLENILEVYEKDNKLYAVMPTFYVSFLAGRKSNIGEKSTWTMEEMMEFINTQPEGTEILPEVSQRDMLDILLKLNMGEFINRETSECYFNEEEFKQLLEFTSTFPADSEEYFMWIEHIEEIRDGDIILMEAGVNRAFDFQMYEYLFNGPTNFIGYPTESGNGAIARACVSVMAMSSGSANKEGAWEFIRFLLAEEQQYEIGVRGSYGFPIRKSALDRIFDKQMEVEYEEDQNGNMVEKSKGGQAFGDKDSPDFAFDYYAPTQEEVDRIRELIESVGNTMEAEADQKIFEIIMEEAGAFYDGQKSVDEVTDIIQSRIQNYLYENQ